MTNNTNIAVQGKNKKEQAKLIQKVISAASDIKGFDISVLDVTDVFSLSDYFVIISGRSDRHVQGITNNIEASLTSAGYKPVTIEGYDKAHWVLIDFGDILVHVFYEQVRSMYDLEALWTNARKLDINQLNKAKSISRVAA